MGRSKEQPAKSSFWWNFAENEQVAVVLIKKYIYDFLTAVSQCDLPFKPKQRKHRFIPNSFHEKKSKRKFSC